MITDKKLEAVMGRMNKSFMDPSNSVTKDAKSGGSFLNARSNLTLEKLREDEIMKQAEDVVLKY